MTMTRARLPMLLDEVEAVRVERLSPSFVRVELGRPCLAEFGVDGPLYDQRIKLIFPHGDAPLPSVTGAEESWYAAWLERPVEERGHLRTYTVREVRGAGADTRLVVDFAVHGADGTAGPGSAWAERARVGDRLLLVGDETAVPAVCAILGQLPWSARGAVFLEVPTAADVQSVPWSPTWAWTAGRSPSWATGAAVWRCAPEHRD